MSNQSLFRTIKRWKRYQPLATWSDVPPGLRGFYVLYRQKGAENYLVVYIGVAGLGVVGHHGIRARLRSHATRKKGWTHFSFFEVHDNVTREEIRELEALLLGIFRHDPRIQLANKQKGSLKLKRLRMPSQWRQSSDQRAVRRRRRRKVARGR